MTVTMDRARRADYPEDNAIHADDFDKTRHGDAVCAILGCNCRLKHIPTHATVKGTRAAHFAIKTHNDRHESHCKYGSSVPSHHSGKPAERIRDFTSKLPQLVEATPLNPLEVQMNIPVQTPPPHLSGGGRRPGAGNPDHSTLDHANVPGGSSRKDYVSDARAVLSYILKTLAEPEFSDRVKLRYGESQLAFDEFFINFTSRAIGRLWDRLHAQPAPDQLSHSPVAAIFQVFRKFDVEQRKSHEPGFWSAAGLYVPWRFPDGGTRVQLWVLTRRRRLAEEIHANRRNLVCAIPKPGPPRSAAGNHVYGDIHLHVVSRLQFHRAPARLIPTRSSGSRSLPPDRSS